MLLQHQLTTFTINGGFLGVDLFFVLSGFLITGLLTAEFDKTSTISLRKFYMRRVLRLGPALAIYLTACLLVAYYTRQIDIWRQLKLIFMAVVYATNWRLAFEWDTVMDSTAIIWSLSIEEQFYLVWPLVLFACFAMKLKRRSIVIGLGLVVLAVAIHRYVLFAGGAPGNRLYYGTDTRADALLTGCFLALFPFEYLTPAIKRGLKFVSIAALVLLAYMVANITVADSFLYAGGFTGVALLAGVLVIVAANSPPRLLSWLLCWKPLRWIGEISYGLYLWHWLVVRNASLYQLGYWEPWAKLGVAVGISAASFYLIERPFNRLKSRFRSGAGSQVPDVSGTHKKFPPTVLPASASTT